MTCITLVSTMRRVLKLERRKIVPGTPIVTAQFGTSLQFIKENNNGNPIPPIVKQCVEYLTTPDVLKTEGLFTVSTNQKILKRLKNQCNQGFYVDFGNDPNVAAGLLTSFFNDLDEPLMTYEFNDEITQFHTLSDDEQIEMIKILIFEELPEDNVELLNYTLQFLSKVIENSYSNKMRSSDLAKIFGGILVKPKPNHKGFSNKLVNQFFDVLITHWDRIFDKSDE